MQLEDTSPLYVSFPVVASFTGWKQYWRWTVKTVYENGPSKIKKAVLVLHGDQRDRALWGMNRLHRSDAVVVGSNLTRDSCMCAFILFVLPCV
jgi:hypothetical protein